MAASGARPTEDSEVTVDETTVHRIPPDGDPFIAFGVVEADEHPCGCCDGWVYLGFETEEDGELVEIIDRVPCRRCADTSAQ